ncbi:hypothetical protein LI177_03850, partial [bacterium 210820-DFI.6.37]|nr:hypothetical protein [bacterium 210820-DFI.6.37]
MKLKKRTLCLAIVLTMVATLFVPISASAETVQWQVPTEPMAVDPEIATVAGHAANTTTVHYLGANLVTARSNNATSSEYPQSVEYIASEFGIYGSNLTGAPDPYMWNHLYNLQAAEGEKVTDVIKPVSANPMGADLNPVSGYESLTKSGKDQVPHSIGMKADILLGISGSNGKTYDDYIALMPDDYDPIQVAYKANNLGDFIDDMYNLSAAIEQSGKKGRYGDTGEIARNYEAYTKGLQLYVKSQLEAGKAEKKTVALVNSTPLENGKYALYNSTMSSGTAASCRAAEYTENTTTNLIDELNIENSGTESEKQYLVTAEDLVKADVIFTTVQGNKTTRETFIQNLKEAGIDEDDLPPIYSTDPAGIFGIQMNSVENFAGVGLYQGFVYPEIINPVYAYTYIVENFYHVTDPTNYKNVAQTLLANASLPEGYTADMTGYTTEQIDGYIAQGLAYYYENEDALKGTTLELTENITENDLSVATVTLEKTSYDYTGSAIEPSVTVKYGDSTLTEGTDYTVSYEKNTDAGNASVVITGKGDYSGTKTAIFTIKGTSIANVKVSDVDAQNYTGEAIKPTVTVTDGNNTLTEGKDYTVSYQNNTNAGTGIILITGIGGYSGTKKVTFTINKKDASGFAVSAIAAQTYTGKAFTPAVTVKDGETTLVKDTDYTVSYKNNTNAGTATVTVTGTGNYTGTKKATFTIKAKAVSGLKVSAVANKAYTGKALKPAVTVKNGTTTL